MTVQDSPHSLLDYECLSDLRSRHFLSFRCPLVNTPQMNTKSAQLLKSLTNDEYRMTTHLRFAKDEGRINYE
jgi:hypothetical protein